MSTRLQAVTTQAPPPFPARWSVRDAGIDLDHEDYAYLVESDDLPTVESAATETDPLCTIRLFLPGSRWKFYVAAVTWPADPSAQTPTVAGFLVSDYGPNRDGYTTITLGEVARLKGIGQNPPERSPEWEPRTVRAIAEHVGRGGAP